MVNNNKNRIQVGEKVKIIGVDSYNIGLIGMMIEDDNSCVPYHVHFDNGDKDWHCEESVEKVNDLDNTKIWFGNNGEMQTLIEAKLKELNVYVPVSNSGQTAYFIYGQGATTQSSWVETYTEHENREIGICELLAMKPIEPVKKKITIDGKDVMISQESFDELKKQLL